MGMHKGTSQDTSMGVMSSHKDEDIDDNSWVQIDFDYTTQLSGESKRIRLEYKYATRGFIY